MMTTTVSNGDNSAFVPQLYTNSSVGAANDQKIYFSSTSERQQNKTNKEFW